MDLRVPSCSVRQKAFEPGWNAHVSSPSQYHGTHPHKNLHSSCDFPPPKVKVKLEGVDEAKKFHKWEWEYMNNHCEAGERYSKKTGTLKENKSQLLPSHMADHALARVVAVVMNPGMPLNFVPVPELSRFGSVAVRQKKMPLKSWRRQMNASSGQLGLWY